MHPQEGSYLPPFTESNARPSPTSHIILIAIASNNLPPHNLLALYHTMVVARGLTRRLWVLGRTGGPRVELGLGFEAVQAAAAAVMRPGVDWALPAPGDLTLCLALGVTPLEAMLAVLGRQDDPTSGGRLRPPAYGGRTARVTTGSHHGAARVSHAAGIAYAARRRGLDEVTLVSVDRHDVDRGDWHEGVNFAAVHGLPLICLVQDREAAAGEPSGAAADLVVERAHGYGISGETVDGSDFALAFAAVERAVGRARAGDGPTVLHARVPNLASIDATGAILAPEHLEATARLDGIDRMRLALMEHDLLDGAADEQLQRDTAGVVEAALDQAAHATAPEPAAALENVFTDA